ncbi:hypothetical protein BGZ58_008783, partial [Dissophora ornata]
SKIVGHSSSPKSIQFINNIAPVVPRPKPPKGVYIQTHSAMQQKARKQLRDEGKNKRSSNCFILYRTRMHPLIVAQYGNQNNKEISKIAGQCWKREPESVKTIYRQMAYDERQKRESLYHSFKSPAAKITGHNPKNVVGDASALSSSSLSSQLSPATEGAARFAASGSNCSQDSDIEPTLASKPERTVKKSNSSNQGLTKKPSQEKKFVVTETALHEFIGDSDLAVKTRNAPKNRTNTSAQPPARRSSKIKSENTNLYGGSATPSVLGELGTSIMANVDFPREFTFVAEGPAATLPTFPATFPQLQQGAISSNSSASPLTFTSFESDSSPSSTLYANLSLAGSALPTSHGWNCESVPLRSDMIPSILDMPIEFDLSLPDTAATTGMLCKGKYPAESGTQQLDLPLPLHLTSQGVELAHPTSVHDPPGCTHSPFLALQQQQQRQSGPFQTTVPCSTNLNQGYPWDLSAFTDSESSTFDNVRHFDSSKTTPIGNAATLFAMEVPMLSSSPLTPMPTPHLMVSTTALGRKSTNNRHTIVETSTSASANGPIDISMTDTATPGPGPSQVHGSGYLWMTREQAQMMATSSEWPCERYQPQHSPSPPVSSALSMIPRNARNSQYTMVSGLPSPATMSMSYPPSNAIHCGSISLGGNDGQHPLARVSNSAADVNVTGCYNDLAAAGLTNECILPADSHHQAQATNLVGGTLLPGGVHQQRHPMTHPFATQMQHQHPSLHSNAILEDEEEDCSDEELSMSIEYYEKVVELQKIRLALQRQMKQQQFHMQQRRRPVGVGVGVMRTG